MKKQTNTKYQINYEWIKHLKLTAISILQIITDIKNASDYINNLLRNNKKYVEIQDAIFYAFIYGRKLLCIRFIILIRDFVDTIYRLRQNNEEIESEFKKKEFKFLKNFYDDDKDNRIKFSALSYFLHNENKIDFSDKYKKCSIIKKEKEFDEIQKECQEIINEQLSEENDRIKEIRIQFHCFFDPVLYINLIDEIKKEFEYIIKIFKSCLSDNDNEEEEEEEELKFNKETNLFKIWDLIYEQGKKDCCKKE